MPGMNEESLSQAEYARHRGVSRFCVTNWKKKGLLAFAADGRVDVAASETLLDSRPATYRGGVTNRPPGTSVPHSGTSVPAKPRKPRPADAAAPERLAAVLESLPLEEVAASKTWTLADAQKEKERFLALLRKHEYALKSGEVVPVKEIELFLSQRHGAIRDKILGWPGKLSEMCADRTRAEIEDILLREAYEVLEELAEGLPT
jgi:hypothetical protein